jgi:hypothetical protein
MCVSVLHHRGTFGGVTRVLQGCYKGVTRVLQECYEDLCCIIEGHSVVLYVFIVMLSQSCVELTSHGHEQGGGRMSKGCHKGVTRELRGRHEDFTRMLQGCDKCVTAMLHGVTRVCVYALMARLKIMMHMQNIRSQIPTSLGV